MNKDRREFIFDGQEPIGNILFSEETGVVQIVIEHGSALKYREVLERIVERISQRIGLDVWLDKEKFQIVNATPFFYYALKQELFSSLDLLVRLPEGFDK